MPVDKEAFLKQARKRQLQEAPVEERLEGLAPEERDKIRRLLDDAGSP